MDVAQSENLHSNFGAFVALWGHHRQTPMLATLDDQWNDFHWKSSKVTHDISLLNFDTMTEL